MHIVIAGGRGLLGQALATRLAADGHTVAILTRSARRAGDVAWNPGDPHGAWRDAVVRADAVINLAGEAIAGSRWTPARKAAILDSRIQATRALATAVADAGTPPVFLSSSAIGIYGPHGDEPLTEDTPPGSDFLAAVCVAWEREAAAVAARTRVVLLRTGVVLAREGGALPQMALPFRFFAGGPVGSGRQVVSWIHVRDWVEMVRWALATSAVAGPLNLTAPAPATSAELARAIGRALRRPAVIPVPALALRLALGEMADVLLHGQRVVPAKAQALGFRFHHANVDAALIDLLGGESRGR